MAEKQKYKYPVAPESIPYLLLFMALGAVFFTASMPVAGSIFTAASLFNIFFFRNPSRNVPTGDVVISPADGRVILVKPVVEKEFMGEEVNKVSIFMNVFNVHINRAPYDGEVLEVRHVDGSFLAADKDAATEENERNYMLIKTAGNLKMLFVQVAGLIARRIVCDIKKGDVVARGERIGLICYGSRVDMYLPKTVSISVKPGDITRAGETIIGVMQNAG